MKIAFLDHRQLLCFVICRRRCRLCSCCSAATSPTAFTTTAAPPFPNPDPDPRQAHTATIPSPTQLINSSSYGGRVKLSERPFDQFTTYYVDLTIFDTALWVTIWFLQALNVKITRYPLSDFGTSTPNRIKNVVWRISSFKFLSINLVSLVELR